MSKINQDNKHISIEQIDNKIIELKKELVLLKIKKITKQNVKIHLIRIVQNNISKMFSLRTSIINKNK
uniref:Ribosomal protein L29 n=1 Tax=Sonderella linearis TaxID=110477 RepID=A0A1Z1MMI1_9FLOR|nr:ribosomal protein L29 [Sonderella linearis]ARW67079.1 ribosomal protein L29 [Sonderella linearis]